MIGIAYRGMAIPLVWKLLGKAGNSSQRERIGLMRGLFWFLTDEQKSDIEAVTADREFVGHHWLSYLIDQNVDFVIRIRKDALVLKAQRTTHAHRIFTTQDLRVLRKPREVFGLSLYMSGQQFKNLGERREKLFSLFRIGLDQPPGGPVKVHMINHLDFKPLIPLLSCT